MIAGWYGMWSSYGPRISEGNEHGGGGGMALFGLMYCRLPVVQIPGPLAAWHHLSLPNTTRGREQQ